MHPVALLLGSLLLAVLIREFVGALVYLTIRWRI